MGKRRTHVSVKITPLPQLPEPQASVVVRNFDIAVAQHEWKPFIQNLFPTNYERVISIISNADRHQRIVETFVVDSELTSGTLDLVALCVHNGNLCVCHGTAQVSVNPTSVQTVRKTVKHTFSKSRSEEIYSIPRALTPTEIESIRSHLHSCLWNHPTVQNLLQSVNPIAH